MSSFLFCRGIEMACYLYKLNESGDIVTEKCFAQDVANLLERGYKSSPEDFKVEDEQPLKCELTNDEVRDAARDANIDKWKTARIDTLKRELGYDD